MNGHDDDAATKAQRCARLETSEEGNVEAPPLVAAFTAGTATVDWRLLSLHVAGAAAVDGTTSAAVLGSPRELLAHRVLAMQHFTAPERTLPGEGVFGRSPDLDSDTNGGLYRRVSRSLSGCSSDDSFERFEGGMRRTALSATPTAVSRQTLVPAAARVDASLEQASLIESTAATHVPFPSTSPLAELTGPSLASLHLPGINAIAPARQAATWSGSSAAKTTTLPPPPPPLPHGLVTPAQVVWQANDAMVDNDLPVSDAAFTPPPLPHLPTAATRSASPFASDARRAGFLVAAEERISTAPTASLHGAVRTQARACWSLPSVISNAEQGHWHTASPCDGRHRWVASFPAQGVHATGGWEVEEEEVWEDNIFDEGGTLRVAELCLWLPRRAAVCCFAAVLWLRRFLGRRGMCTMICPPLDSASESDSYYSGSDTPDSSEREAAGQRGDTGGMPRLLGIWPRRTAHVFRPLLSASPTTHWGRRHLQRAGMARSLWFARGDDPGTASSEEEEETNGAASSSLSLLPISSFMQSLPGVTTAAGNRGLGEDRRLREAASADGVVESPSCFSLPCSITGALLCRSSAACCRALRRTVAYYNVFASQCASEMQTYEAGAPDTANRHAMPGSSAPSHPAEHSATAGIVSATPLPPLPTNAHSLRQPLLLDIAFVGQVYVLLQYVALVLLTATVVLLTVFSVTRSRVAHVEDATACNRYPFDNVIPPDLSFSLICFLLNGVFAVRYAVRAVRYEKGGPLVVQVVVVALQVCRAVYFLLVVARRCMRVSSESLSSPFPRPLWPSLRIGARGSIATIFSSGVGAFGSEGAFVVDDRAPTAGSVLQPLFALTCVCVTASVSLFLAASVLSPWVYASFGWRRYAQGIVQVSFSRVRQRLTVLRTCVQLDGVITANAYLATVFLLDSWPDQRTLLLMTLTTFAVHCFLIPMLRRSRHWWPLLCAASVLVTVSAYYAAVIGGTLRKDHRLLSVSSSPWYSDCYTDRLRKCLYEISAEYPVGIFRDASAVHSDGDLCLSYDQLEGVRWQSLLAAVRRHGSRDARVGLGLTPPCFALAVSSRSTPPARHVSNATDTYLPTYGAYPDYFRIQGCNATCFLAREERDNFFFERRIAGCCAEYGQCRLKDDYRTYAVLLLLMLMICSSAVRVTLLAVAWRRWVEEDDGAIELFIQEHCRCHHLDGYRRRRRYPRREYGHRHRRAAAAAADGSGPLSQSPRRLQVPHDATFSASPPLTQNPPWDVEQYVAWRQQQWTDEITASLAEEVGR